MKHHRLVQRVVAAILFASLVVGCGPILPRGTPTPKPVDSTETLKPTLTPTSSNTPNPSVTPSPRPTRTATPIPAWVTDFAEPILAAIADRPPVCQDDFSQTSADWERAMLNCPDDGCVISDGFLRMTAYQGQNDDWTVLAIPCYARFKTFALKVDIDTSHLVGENAAGVGYDYEGVKFAIEIKKQGRWWLYNGIDLSGDLLQPVPAIITLTVIAGETRMAVYLDDIPITMKEFTPARNNTILTLRSWAGSPANAIVIYDNLKIWDLDNIPNLP